MSARHVMFVVNADWFFWSHRLNIAKAAARAGYRVTVAAAVERGYDEMIRREGLRFLELPIDRSSRSIVRDAKSIVDLWRLYRAERPDLVHHVTIKPVIYGSIAARLAGVTAVVNAISGLGYVFTGGGSRWRERMAGYGYRLALSGTQTKVIFQNKEDQALFVARRLITADQGVLIRGAGVDLSQFAPADEPAARPRVLFASRLLWDKGLGDLVDAVKILRARSHDFRFIVAGAPDPANPRSIPTEIIEEWQRQGVLEWLGHREDMPEVLRQASIVVLPTSYREGIPKVLIEAAAAGRPIVTTDAPGCHDIVQHGVNGLLIPPGNIAALADSLETLLVDKDLRAQMGRRSRERAAEFSEEHVISATLAVYSALLGRDARAC